MDLNPNLLFILISCILLPIGLGTSNNTNLVRFISSPGNTTIKTVNSMMVGLIFIIVAIVIPILLS